MAVSAIPGATDTFDSSISGSWTSGEGDYGDMSWTAGGYVQCAASATISAMRRNTGVYGNDQYATVIVQTHSATDINVIEAQVRAQASATDESRYTGTVFSTSAFGTGKYGIFELDSTFGSTQLSSAGTEASVASGTRLRVEAEGSAIRLYTDEGGTDTLRTSATDATIASGWPGLGAYANSTASRAQITAWEAGTLWQQVGSYLVAIGPSVSGTAGVTPLWVDGHAANDVAFTYIESAGGEPANLGTANGFAAVADSPSAVGVTTAGTQISVYWCRASGAAQSGPIVTDPGDHVHGRLVVVRGLITTGDPWDVTAASVNAIAVTSTTAPGDTTTVAGCLILQGIAWSIDNAGPIFSSPTNADLTGLVELADDGTTSGNGGGSGVFGAVKTTAGAFGDTTVTCTSSITASHTMALKPVPSGSAVKRNNLMLVGMGR